MWHWYGAGGFKLVWLFLFSKVGLPMSIYWTEFPNRFSLNRLPNRSEQGNTQSTIVLSRLVFVSGLCQKQKGPTLFSGLAYEFLRHLSLTAPPPPSSLALERKKYNCNLQITTFAYSQPTLRRYAAVSGFPCLSAHPSGVRPSYCE